ncbi:hypothetical protein M409DRAFT_52832 [Zasmidium cellare ATCC 36951]|uniref:P-loop containing nucleoside triphosphate hydrolase protein n=1 Tax=Zasmidium cellare ATCC 36951 TaxID=1080233 RepID=A0A6A6CNH1_ZASCE|nr:uncharacterized protein M409DRAFT_52832 [Zasmidium cellare ATCC 36951]KAF2168827.1 hypothetical protein M409DRAFT_52832 [Zasmidium cellare ATCC 36951]
MDEAGSRTVPMQVLALGMSRSGTESIRKALEEMGYLRTYHGVQDLLAGKDGFTWAQLAERKYGKNPQPITREHFYRILGDCAAVTDMPCCAFWSELMDAYPQAKILLVERDVEEWFRSFETVILKEVFSWKRDVIAFAIRVGLFPPNPNIFINGLFLNYFQARNTSELARNARSVYMQHYDAIEARAKLEGRPVLRMRLEEGWGPMCEFLGKQQPSGHEGGALPKGNEGYKTAANTRMHQNRAMRFLALIVAKSLAKVGAGVAVAVLLVMVSAKTMHRA